MPIFQNKLFPRFVLTFQIINVQEDLRNNKSIESGISKENVGLMHQKPTRCTHSKQLVQIGTSALTLTTTYSPLISTIIEPIRSMSGNCKEFLYISMLRK